ncbi:MAG: hypothetical protein K8F91_08470, partial [Candidatus Obscuribacterales bacterium]|nr:hypothetical protein [Candidatus Obscuribacterales bacterium]
MAKLDELYLQKLRDAGLFVSSPYSPTHGWPDGVRVGKPTTTRGNSIPGYKAGYIVIGPDADEPPEMDAPMVVLYSVDNKWIVHSQECVPKLGPGDFVNVWSTPEEAISDILDFFLGDPERMEKKTERKEAARKRA